MATSTNNELNTPTKPWLFSIFKEAFEALILGILSGTTIAYFVSRLFVKNYLDNIGFGGLAYDALLNNDTISAFTMGVGMIIFLYVCIFTLPNLILRHLYHEQVHLMQAFHDKYKRWVDVFLMLAIFMPPIVSLGLIHFGIKFEIYFVINFIIPLGLCLWIISFNKSEKNIPIFSYDTMKLLGVAFALSVVLVVTFFPFYLMVGAIDNLGVDFRGSLLIAVVIWLIYSIFYGFRITENGFTHLLIDLVIGLGLLGVTLIYSSNTIKIPIANFVSIKDPSARVYKISEKDFEDIQKNITTLWDRNNPPNQCSFQNILPSYMVRSAKNSLTKDVYLSTLVIFRDSKNLIICPPNYSLNSKQPTVACFISKSEAFTPTSLDTLQLNENPAFIDKVWVVEKEKEK